MQVRCPRCGSLAPVEPGRMPVCPACGFAGGPLVEGPGVPPARPSPKEFVEPPTPMPRQVAAPEPAGRGVGGGWIFFMILLGILLVGAIALAVAYQRGIIDYNPFP